MLSIPSKVLCHIILHRMKNEVDKVLRDEQAWFRQERSCTDQIATFRIILEQTIEWQTSPYLTFIDFEKAFDSIDYQVLWDILRHYGSSVASIEATEAVASVKKMKFQKKNIYKFTKVDRRI